MTRYQALIIRYMEWHIWRYGYPPSVQDLAAGFGVQVATMDAQLRKMMKRKLLDWHQGERWPVNNRSNVQTLVENEERKAG